MTTEPQAAADAPLSIDAFVGELDKAQDAPVNEDEDKAEAEAGAEDEAAEEVDAAAEDEEIEASEDDEEEEAPRVAPPQSWAKEDHEAWNELTPKAQQVVLKREADRDRAVAEAATKAGKAAADVKGLAERYEVAAKSITDDVTRASQTWNKKWGNVDWVRYARENPKAYTEDKALADAERQDIIEYANHQRKVQADADAAAELARKAFLSEEWTKLETLSPELTDPAKGKERRKEVIEYLGGQGFTQDVLVDVSAVELTIARKAMLWDSAQKAATKQAQIPRKNPVSTTKALPSGGASGGGSTPQRDLQEASRRLTKVGSIDAFVGLLNAEEQARSRKVKRT